MANDLKQLHVRRLVSMLGTLSRIEQEGQLSVPLQLAKEHMKAEYNRYVKLGIYGF